MAFTALNTLSDSDKLKLTVLCDVKKICQEVGDGLTNKVTFDKQSLELIAEIVWHRLQDYSTDLELFARHGKRAKISADDVKLLVRKNECLKARISKMSEEFSCASSSKKTKKDRDSDTGAGPSDCAEDNNLIGNFDFDDILDDNDT